MLRKLPNLSFARPLQRFQSTEAAPLKKVPRRKLRYPSPKTHLLTFPLHENPVIWARLEELRSTLREEGISGLGPEIILPRLNDHLELKVGNLNIKGGESASQDAPSFEHGQVMEVLLGLKEPIQKLLTAGGDGKLRVELGQLRSLAFRGVLDPDKTHVVLLEPTEGAMLQQINELVFRTFKDAAMLVDSAATPNHMSCTVINTGHRAGYELGKPRIPFRLEALYASQALKRLRLASADTVPDLKQPLKLDIGTAIIPGLRLRRRLGEVRPESKDVIYDGQLDF